MSLRRRLLFALLGVVLLAGIIASTATYYSARAEVDALLDEELRQVALSLREHALLNLGLLAPAPEDFERRVVVQIWDRFGLTVYLSNASTPLPLAREPGYATIQYEGREWRMFALHAGLQTIQTAQSTAVRTERAAAAALRVLVPVLGALPLLGVLVWLVLEGGFAPLTRLAAEVRARNATGLEPLRADHLPEEIEPLISALNHLLSRLGESFDAQRRFAADAAHELRTPLTALALQIQLAERARTEEERTVALGRLKERVSRATRLVQQLLAMARLEPEAARSGVGSVALDELTRSLVAEKAPLAAQKNIAIAQHLEPAATQGIEDALRVLVSNLLDNAIRYAPVCGHVEVRTGREGGRAFVEVADDGPGIPPEEHVRVFDRFYRGANAAATGSGLGLAIVRQVADLHRGTLDLREGLGGRGVAVRLTLSSV
jgi:two-component system, OmpR family, sensor kinase